MAGGPWRAAAHGAQPEHQAGDLHTAEHQVPVSDRPNDAIRVWIPDGIIQAQGPGEDRRAKGNAQARDNVVPGYAAKDARHGQDRQADRQQQDDLQQSAQELSQHDLNRPDRRDEQSFQGPTANLAADRVAEQSNGQDLSRHELEPHDGHDDAFADLAGPGHLAHSCPSAADRRDGVPEMEDHGAQNAHVRQAQQIVLPLPAGDAQLLPEDRSGPPVRPTPSRP